MGYYTKHELSYSVPFDSPEADQIEKVIESDDDARYAVGDNGTGDKTKWYDHEKFMRRLSLQFPSVKFELSGTGEESGDIWKENYENGKRKLRRARMVMPTIDEVEWD